MSGSPTSDSAVRARAASQCASARSTCSAQNFDADIRRRIGDAKVAKLTPEALRSCIDAPRKRGAPGAAAQIYRTLRGLINFAIKRGHIEGADPMRGIDNPKPYRPAPVVAASDAELVALLQVIDESSCGHAPGSPSSSNC